MSERRVAARSSARDANPLHAPRPWVLVPIEVKVRELEAKVVFACAAAEAGYGVVVGSHRALRPSLHRFPPSIVVDYGVGLPFSRLYQAYRRHGHRVVALEEEGLIELPTDAVSDVDLFCAWGSKEAERVAASTPEAARRIRVTGNPRIDILRPEFRAMHEPEVARLRARFGRYILVNTNFPANIQFGIDILQEINRFDTASFDDERYEFYRERDVHSGRLFTAFQEMIGAVAAAHPSHTVVLRPHPSENVDAWRTRLAGITNVHIEHSGNVVQWILGADVVIHNSCTTAIEAHLLGTDVIAYRPFVDDRFDWELANTVSREVYGLAELLEAVDASVAHGPRQRAPSAHPVLRPHLEALDGELAVERMVRCLDEVACVPATVHWTTPMRLRNRADVGVVTLKHTIKFLLRKTKVPLALERQKNPGWALAEVVGVIDRARSASGRFERIRACRLAPDITAIVST